MHVFSGTLASDLRMAAPDAVDDELLAVLRAVRADEWVSLLPQGLETEVGAEGHELTPMRAQQLALARLILMDPDLVILDEATAEAGSAGADALEFGAEAALRGRSAVIVAHRLSQAALADRVIVLEHGRVVEEGTHDELARGVGTTRGCGRPGRGIGSSVHVTVTDSGHRVIGVLGLTYLTCEPYRGRTTSRLRRARGKLEREGAWQWVQRS